MESASSGPSLAHLAESEPPDSAGQECPDCRLDLGSPSFAEAWDAARASAWWREHVPPVPAGVLDSASERSATFSQPD